MENWRTQSHRSEPDHFVFPSRLYRGQRALDLAAVLKRKIRPAFEKLGFSGVGWHTFRHTVGTLLAEMGGHQLPIRDYLRHSNLSVTNKYLQAGSATRRKIGWLQLFCPVNSGWQSRQKRLHSSCTQNKEQPTCKSLKNMAGTTGLEPTASAVTVQRDTSTFSNMEEHGRHCKSLEVHHRHRYCVSPCVSRVKRLYPILESIIKGPQALPIRH